VPVKILWYYFIRLLRQRRFIRKKLQDTLMKTKLHNFTKSN